MDIKEVFMSLTTKTYPMGTEKEVYKLLPDTLKKDKFDNLFYIIGNPDTVFISHMDTIGNSSIDVTHVIEGDFIKTDKTTILGADDKAGVTLMLYMMEKNIPGFYLFTVGEEKGCAGSSKLSKFVQNNKDNRFTKIKKIVSFDRMGYDSIITHQSGQRCCSEEFSKALGEELNKYGFNFKSDPGGMYSDSGEFGDIFSECTNLSVGYFDQHTNNEKQNIKFLQQLADACCKVNWPSLPSVRDPKKIEFVDGYYFGEKQVDEYPSHPFDIDYKDEKIHTEFFHDEVYDSICDFSTLDGKIVDITLSSKRTYEELEKIESALNKFGIPYDNIEWDGLILYVEDSKNITKMDRNELLEFVPDLSIDFIKSQKKEKK